jgi:DNA-binding response OmpR family regulator
MRLLTKLLRDRFALAGTVKLLVVKARLKGAAFLLRMLKEEGYVVDFCTGDTEAYRLVRSGQHQLILIDWMPPILDGPAICQEMRAQGVGVPILILGARAEPADRVLALKWGADSYLGEPFEVNEFLSRIRVLLRYSAGIPRFQTGMLKLDPHYHTVRLRGTPLTLTLREYAILQHLMYRINQPVSRAELLNQVWDRGPTATSNMVDAAVCRIRDKLGDCSWMLETVRGLGYCLRSERPA